MDPQTLAAQAREAGMLDARVVPFRLRTGSMALKLYWGPRTGRLSEVIHGDTPPEDVLTLLARLKDRPSP